MTWVRARTSGAAPHRRALVQDGLCVLGREGHDAARAEADPAACGRARQDQQIIGAHIGDGALNGGWMSPLPISIMMMTAATPMMIPASSGPRAWGCGAGPSGRYGWCEVF